MVLLLIPIATHSSVEPQEYKIVQEPYVYATLRVTASVKPVVAETYKTPQHIVLKSVLSPLGTNCVAYAASKKELPQGLATLSQKKAKIKTNKPSIGAIGITAEGPVGHLIYIEAIKDDTLIISEGNYRHGYVTWREIPRALVLGYL